MAVENEKECGDLEVNHSALLVDEESKENEKEDDVNDVSLNRSLLLNEEGQIDPKDRTNHVDVEFDEECKQQQLERTTWKEKLKWICLTNWMKDEPPSIQYFPFLHRLCGKFFRLKEGYQAQPEEEEEEEEGEEEKDLEPRAPFFENTESVKLAKFFILTLFLLLCTHFIVRSMKWEYDDDFGLKEFFQYDFISVVLDLFVYFVIGRLFRQKGVDRLFPCVIPMMAGCIFPSLINEWKIFRYSFSMFEIMCRWPAQLFIAISVGLIIVFSLVYLHVRTFYIQGVFLSRFMELIIIISIFVFPNFKDPNFHIHHWFAAWLIGMLANSNESWSLATLCFAWGYYINGIAVYGRDPILGCAYSFYTSTNLNCKYMQCFVDQNATNSTGNTTTVYYKFIPPDWRTCTEGYYAY